MADNIQVTPSAADSPVTVLADEVTDGTLGTGIAQYVKIMDGTLNGTAKAAVSSTGLKIDLSDGTTSISVETAGADAVSNTSNRLKTVARLLGFNGTTWDRIKCGLSAVQTTLTGILNTLPLAIYNTTLPTLANGNVAALQVTASGQLITIVGAALPTGTNVIGKIALTPATTGGLTPFVNLSLDTVGYNIKNSAGQIYGYYIANKSTSWRYVKLYNTASTPVVGTDAPYRIWPLPPSSAANVSFPNGLAFATGIGIAATTGPLDADTGNPSANDVIVTIEYN